MKTQKIVFRVITGILSLGMLMSGFMYLTSNPKVVEGFTLLGFPLTILPFLGLAKIAGAIVLQIPKFEAVKEWAYAGFTFTFVGAVWFHITSHTPFVGPLIALVLLVASYLLRKRQLTQSVVA
jgi:hypothetical protein